MTHSQVSPDLSPIAAALIEAGQLSVHISGGAQGGLLVAVMLHSDGAYQSGVVEDWTAVSSTINQAVQQFVRGFMDDVADESPSAAELVTVTAEYFRIRHLSMPANIALLGWAREAMDEETAVSMAMEMVPA